MKQLRKTTKFPAIGEHRQGTCCKTCHFFMDCSCACTCLWKMHNKTSRKTQDHYSTGFRLLFVENVLHADFFLIIKISANFGGELNSLWS